MQPTSVQARSNIKHDLMPNTAAGRRAAKAMHGTNSALSKEASANGPCGAIDVQLTLPCNLPSASHGLSLSVRIGSWQELADLSVVGIAYNQSNPARPQPCALDTTADLIIIFSLPSLTSVQALKGFSLAQARSLPIPSAVPRLA